MTGEFETESATPDRVDLGAFPKAGVAVVFGAGGGIGGALVEAIKAAEKFKHVVSFRQAVQCLVDHSMARNRALEKYKLPKAGESGE